MELFKEHRSNLEVDPVQSHELRLSTFLLQISICSDCLADNILHVNSTLHVDRDVEAIHSPVTPGFSLNHVLVSIGIVAENKRLHLSLCCKEAGIWPRIVHLTLEECKCIHQHSDAKASEEKL